MHPDPLKRSTGNLRSLAGYATGHWRCLAAVAVLANIGALSEAALLTVLSTLAFSVGGNHRGVSLGPIHLDSVPYGQLVGIAIGLVIIRFVCQFAQSAVPARAGARSLLRTRQRLVHAFLQSSWRSRSAVSVGELSETVGPQALMAYQGFLVFADGVASMTQVVTLLAFAVLLQPVVTILLVGASALLLWLMRPLSGRVWREARDHSANAVSLASDAGESHRLLLDAEVSGVNSALDERLSVLVHKLRRNFERTQLATALVPIAFQSAALLVAVLLFAGMQRYSSLDPQTLGAVLLVLVRALSIAQNAQRSQQRALEQAPFRDRVIETISGLEANRRPVGTVELGDFERAEFIDVSFRYSESAPFVVDSFSAEVDAGECVGIVGPSGAGKTTLALLLAGVLDATLGEVRVNGRGALDYERTSWAGHIAYVPQEPRLQDATVLDNVIFMRPWISREAALYAVHRAGLTDEIEHLELGFDTVIGGNFARLSGGQKQRLSFARVLAGEPDVLIVDEPTSSLDRLSERRIYDCLASLRAEGRTIVIVAHRADLLELCTRTISTAAVPAREAGASG
jgi:ATP-binding cassette subfamily B protein